MSIHTTPTLSAKKSAALERIGSILKDDPVWSAYGEKVHNHQVSVHLAILVEPYLGYVLDGRKTIESRFSVVQCAPYKRVETGDIVLLKRSGGPIVGVCEVSTAWFYELDVKTLRSIRQEFATSLCARDAGFWDARKGASYASLMRIQHVRPLPNLSWEKRDRRGWVILVQRNEAGFW